jgi:hypothetical protein
MDEECPTKGGACKTGVGGRPGQKGGQQSQPPTTPTIAGGDTTAPAAKTTPQACHAGNATTPASAGVPVLPPAEPTSPLPDPLPGKRAKVYSDQVEPAARRLSSKNRSFITLCIPLACDIIKTALPVTQ